MLDLTAYLDDLVAALRARFGARLLYVGLQGSRLRGEARKDSDIDVMLVLEGLTYEDLTAYRALLQALGQFDLACGFVCGREDLLRWNPLELYHLLHTTGDVYGALAPLLPPHTRADAARYVQLGSNNLFHELCHRTVHGAAPCAPGFAKCEAGHQGVDKVAAATLSRGGTPPSGGANSLVHFLHGQRICKEFSR